MTSSCLQTPDTDAFYSRTKALVPQHDKCLNVFSNFPEVWCVPSATHVLLYIEVRMKFWTLENLKTIFFVSYWFLGITKCRKFPRSGNIYVYTAVSFHYRNQFSKDTFSTDPQFTHCLTHPLNMANPTTMMMSQRITFAVFTEKNSPKYILLKATINDSVKHL